MPIPEHYRIAGQAWRIELIASSFARLVGRPLVEGPLAVGDDIASALWSASAAIVAHGTEADPVFFFGNRRALEIFESDVASFTRMPSRLSAPAPARGERQALLDQVSRHGYIGDYAGIRITAKGKPFRIEGAIVWNLLDKAGTRHGQAATFMM